MKELKFTYDDGLESSLQITDTSLIIKRHKNEMKYEQQRQYENYNIQIVDMSLQDIGSIYYGAREEICKIKRNDEKIILLIIGFIAAIIAFLIIKNDLKFITLSILLGLISVSLIISSFFIKPRETIERGSYFQVENFRGEEIFKAPIESNENAILKIEDFIKMLRKAQHGINK